MFELKSIAEGQKASFYKNLNEQLRHLLEGEKDLIANAANAASLLYWSLPEINWAGFYFLKEGELVLGPFQGKPACVRIAVGRGVCGSAAQKRETLLVANVNEFPGHIACDSASQSEIVVPLIKYNKIVGVLDVDSPAAARFDEADKEGLEAFVAIFTEKTNLL